MTLINYFSYFVTKPNQEVEISANSISKALSQYSEWKIGLIKDLSVYSFDLSSRTVVHIHVNAELSKKLCDKIEELSSSFTTDLLFIFHLYDVQFLPDLSLNKNMVFCTNTNNKRLALREAGIDHCFVLVPCAYAPMSLSDGSFDLTSKLKTGSIEVLPDEYKDSFIESIKKLGFETVVTNNKTTCAFLEHVQNKSFLIKYQQVSRETLLAHSCAFFVFEDIDVSAYLQPWIYDAAVYGTKRPFVIEDFERKNIDFSQVYEKHFPVDFVDQISYGDIVQNKHIIAREYSLNATFRLIQKMITYGFTDKFQKNFEKLGGKL